MKIISIFCLLLMAACSKSQIIKDTTKAKVITYGDSNNNEYSGYLGDSLDTAKFYPIVIHGKAGRDWKTGYLEMDSVLGPEYDPTISRNILVPILGTNDFFGDVHSDTTRKYAPLFLQKAKEMGFLITSAICPEPRHQPDSLPTVHFYAGWPAYETWFRVSWRSQFKADAMMPLVDDPYIGRRLNSNLDYWADFGVHYTDLGDRRLAYVVRPYVEALYERTGIIRIELR